jgi:hypothetical protein
LIEFGKARFEHELPPLSVCASKIHPSLFYVTEWNDVTIWDARATRGGLVERLVGNQIAGGGSGPLWASSASGNTFCVGGEDRTVSLYDDRKYRIVDTWKCPLKHDIVGLYLEDEKHDFGHCVALGLDHEIANLKPQEAAKSENIKDVGAGAEDDDPDEAGSNYHGRLHHNHRVFRAKSRWTGLCKVNGKLIGRDSEGSFYIFGKD